MNREAKFRYLRKGKRYYIDFNNDNLGIKFSEYERRKTTKLLEYTGLKDKDGTDIYEGDIVRIDGAEDFEMEVKFENGAFEPVYSQNYDGKQIEIIGNIYENPDLISKSENEKDT